MKINILDKSIYNRIAAGEVVERPFSVVKELVENSIDAGAKNIEVSIFNGGKDRVVVEDDGCGIEKSEMEKAFLPHATSKISEISDLDAILTLGFRGEALASIASVAKVKIVSKPKAQPFGASISAEGGIVGNAEDAPSPDGTRISVDNLFYNTPVRAGFLKSSRAEEGDITDIIGRLILANPDISFKYNVDGKLVLQSYGGGIEEAVISVYGASTVRNCFYIKSEKNGIKIEGYIGKHSFTKSNRTYQTLVVNGRYVVNQTVSAAMQNAYQAYLMKRQYPFYVLKLTLPSDAVDVNVHPNKTDVRFKNNQVVYSAVYSIVSKVLDGTDEALNIVKDDNDFLSDVKSDKNAESKSDFADKQFTQSNPPKPSAPLDRSSFGNIYYVLREDAETAIPPRYDKNYIPPAPKEKNLDDIFEENKRYILELERKKAEEKARAEETARQSAQTDLGIDEPFVYIGQILKTYLIYQKGTDIYFIDQHAAHERLLFDKLFNKAVNGSMESQPLLLPYVLNLNNVEYEIIRSRLPYLNELGFSMEEFGSGAYRVTEIPSELTGLNLDSFFADILSDSAFRIEKIPDVIREKLCQRACKAAIKAGHEMTELEREDLMRELNGNMGLKCPHGRPIAVKITQTEIEKWFKRIV